MTQYEHMILCSMTTLFTLDESCVGHEFNRWPSLIMQECDPQVAYHCLYSSIYMVLCIVIVDTWVTGKHKFSMLYKGLMLSRGQSLSATSAQG